jgi:hypothetical protein
MRHERTNLPLTLGEKGDNLNQSSRTGKPMRQREFITVMGAVAGLPLAARAQGTGQKQPTEIQTLIDNHIDAFNTQNIELFRGVFGDTAIIIDGIAPSACLSFSPISLSSPTTVSANSSVLPVRRASRDGIWR